MMTFGILVSGCLATAALAPGRGGQEEAVVRVPLGDEGVDMPRDGDPWVDGVMTVAADAGRVCVRVYGMARQSKPPAKPIEFWAYEASPFCRIVKEVRPCVITGPCACGSLGAPAYLVSCLCASCGIDPSWSVSSSGGDSITAPRDRPAVKASAPSRPLIVLLRPPPQILLPLRCWWS
jgi:hypothetical protein